MDCMWNMKKIYRQSLVKVSVLSQWKIGISIYLDERGKKQLFWRKCIWDLDMLNMNFNLLNMLDVKYGEKCELKM